MIAVDPTGKTFTAQPGSGVGTTLAGTIAVMSATMLNQGVYDLAEAALLLGRGPGHGGTESATRLCCECLAGGVHGDHCTGPL